MLVFILLFLVGIGVGYIVRSRKRIVRGANRSLDIVIYVLLFSLGATIGMDETLISNIGKLGFDALLLTIGAVLGSIVVLYPVQHLFVKAGQ